VTAAAAAEEAVATLELPEEEAVQAAMLERAARAAPTTGTPEAEPAAKALIRARAEAPAPWRVLEWVEWRVPGWPAVRERSAAREPEELPVRAAWRELGSPAQAQEARADRAARVAQRGAAARAGAAGTVAWRAPAEGRRLAASGSIR